LLVDDAFFDREKFLDSVHFYTLQDIAQEPSAAQIVGKYAEDKDKLRWCLKPVFMHYLLRKNLVDSVLYVDNDIYFFDNFLPLFDYVGKHELWLTPHWRCMNPFIDPHVFKDNFTDGMFNAGFVGASKAGLHILEWWSMVNSYRCEKNRAEGFWDDQRYLDMLPIRFPGVGIVRHMGCNVAVWNKRDCTRVLVSNKLLIQGEFPIVFIHFTKDTMDDIAMSKYGGDPLLMPYLSEYNGSIQESKQLLGEY
jgi:hypothetical protein